MVKELAFEQPIRDAMDDAETITVGDLSVKSGWEIDLCLNRLNILAEQRGWSKGNGAYSPPAEVACGGGLNA